jgi:nucleotide-binding universal stress UspA family protein
MKAILGIDNQGAWAPAVKLFSALRFPQPEVTLLHAVEASVPFVPVAAEPSVQSEYHKVLQNLGLAALDDAKDACCARNIRTKGQMVFGGAVQALTFAANEKNVDLIAIAAHPRSRWNPSFLSSVTRGLSIDSDRSVLIAKGDIPERRPLRAVLAIDHSKYSARWLDKFLSMHPAGISEIHVVTAYDLTPHEIEVLKANVPSAETNTDAWLQTQLEEMNAKVVDRLAKAGYAAYGHVVPGRAEDGIRRTMQDTQADLLIMGAQGHGFIERVFIGSVSLHQALYEPYPVLIVRP